VISDFYKDAIHWINCLNRQEWLYLLLAAMLAGFFCMRGFGSRNNY